MQAGRGNFAARIGKEVMRYLTEYFGVADPMPKNDHLYSRGLRHEGGLLNGMENWGLVMYQPNVLMFNSSENNTYYAKTVIHECVHSWFGNLVTFKWWDQVWLNEGLTTYFTFTSIDHLDPDIGAWEKFFDYSINVAMNADCASPGLSALSGKPTDTRSFKDKMDPTLSYSKGSCIVRMMESILTEGIR